MIPLHRACLRGDLEITRLLLKSGSNPNARNNFDETALHFACKRGHPAMIHLLLEYGADILAGDKKGRALMHHAAQGGCVCVTFHYLITNDNTFNLLTPA